MSKFSQRQKGAVSLFLVIFAALLIVTVTVAFIRTMIQGQQQATANDLSKSALDSAQAGVEDAKRAILAYHAECSGSGGGETCAKQKATLVGQECNTIQKLGIAGGTNDDEVMVGQNEATDAALQQAYTCVKVTLNTDDYVGTLKPGESRLIPLKSTGPFDRVSIEWYSVGDLQGAQTATQPDGSKKVYLDTNLTLPKAADWREDRPSLIRAQLLQFGNKFKLTDFDTKDVKNADTATLFLMPSIIGSPQNTVGFTDDYASGALQPVACDENFSTVSVDSAYACKAIAKLPLAVGSSDKNDRTAYLRIQAPYNTQTTFRITMQNGNSKDPVKFDGVQPIVDSTGRANDLFRRVMSRVEFNDASFPYVEGTLDIRGNLCKTFSVSDTAQRFDPGNCNPNE